VAIPAWHALTTATRPHSYMHYDFVAIGRSSCDAPQFLYSFHLGLQVRPVLSVGSVDLYDCYRSICRQSLEMARA
jgi:hypothetical protein